jgi:hypothetical protein
MGYSFSLSDFFIFLFFLSAMLWILAIYSSLFVSEKLRKRRKKKHINYAF